MSATMLLGVATSELVLATGAPATKATCPVIDAPAAIAVTVFVSALVDFSVVANRPLLSVLPDAAANVLLLPLLASVTAKLGTGLPNASRTTKLRAVVAVPLATTLLGDRVSARSAEAGAPATKVTFACGVAAPALSVIVLASALFDRSVAENWPALVVLPLVSENVSLPPALLLASVTAWAVTTFP